MKPDPPAWVRDAVFYQVFPDRFASSPRVRKPGALEPWSDPPTFDGYKGGDLLGLADRLDELVDLGITAIYLNPIFKAASNHRYNAYDYLAVDPLLGGDAALRELLDAAHTRAIRVILDGVFNHSGRGFWPFHHVLEAGGASPYRDWFYLDRDILTHRRGLGAYDDGREAGGTHPPKLGYRMWWDVPSLPKLRIENPEVREYLFGVAEHWIRFGADGWRLDVPEEIEDKTFWREFRDRVRAINPEAYLLGEIWEEAPEWLRGDRFDALMNYPLTLAILGFVGGDRIDRHVIAAQANYRRGLVALDGPAFGAQLEHLMTLYEPDVTAVQFNLLGSHDTPRARTVMGGDPIRLRLATLLQLMLPGAPSIYYGDELAMEGGADPDCRRAYPEAGAATDPAAAETRALVKEAISLRRRFVQLRHGTVSVVSRDRAVAVVREADGRRAIVAVNAGDETAFLDLSDRGGLQGMKPVPVPGIAGGATDEIRNWIRLQPMAALVLIDS
jgi:cyclomaltodextrinase